MTDGIKPCPFCGFRDVMVEDGVGQFWVSCPADDFTDDDDFADRGCGITGPLAPAYGEAIAAWNRRAEPVSVQEADIPDYDAGLLNDFGGGNVDWWMDYIRAEIERANEHWRFALRALAADKKE